MNTTLTKAAEEAPAKCWPQGRQRETFKQPWRKAHGPLSFWKQAGGRPGGRPGAPPKLKFAPVPDSTATMRLNRYIAQAGVCSAAKPTS